MAKHALGTDTLNDLLRGEIAAAETYKQALDKLRPRPESQELRAIELEHGEAIKELRTLVVRYGGDPVAHSGPWGVWARAVEGAAKLLGDATALRALLQGEEYGQGQYESAIDNQDLPIEARDYLRDDLLPKTRAHVERLSRLIERL